MGVHVYMKHVRFKAFKASLTIGTSISRTFQRDDFSPIITERWTIIDISPNQVKLQNGDLWTKVMDIESIFINPEWTIEYN